jgi:hypothetical protein
MAFCPQHPLGHKIVIYEPTGFRDFPNRWYGNGAAIHVNNHDIYGMKSDLKGDVLTILMGQVNVINKCIPDEVLAIYLDITYI